MSNKEKKEGLTEQEEVLSPAEQEPEVENKPAEEQPDYYEKYVRLSADFENFRRRTEREKAALLAYGKKDFVEKLLPAYEVLLRQQAKMEKQTVSKECSAEIKSLLGGIKMVLGELDKAFKAEGIEKMDVIDTPYDPMKEECIATIPSSSKQDGMVLEEVQMGFMMDGKVLRPARVVVGKAGEEA
ncbi:MAG: nucleotide exchange factor GrpE [Elusimicrobiaceae bacterium]|nr:nucleotide exchange factor GrpE [Elusimicrobiaceae bacterium]